MHEICARLDLNGILLTYTITSWKTFNLFFHFIQIFNFNRIVNTEKYFIYHELHGIFGY